jgi:hypothetical protein
LTPAWLANPASGNLQIVQSYGLRILPPAGDELFIPNLQQQKSLENPGAGRRWIVHSQPSDLG